MSGSWWVFLYTTKRHEDLRPVFKRRNLRVLTHMELKMQWPWEADVLPLWMGNMKMTAEASPWLQLSHCVVATTSPWAPITSIFLVTSENSFISWHLKTYWSFGTKISVCFLVFVLPWLFFLASKQDFVICMMQFHDIKRFVEEQLWMSLQSAWEAPSCGDSFICGHLVSDVSHCPFLSSPVQLHSDFVIAWWKILGNPGKCTAQEVSFFTQEPFPYLIRLVGLKLMLAGLFHWLFQ